MVEILLGVIVGYALAFAPQIVSIFTSRQQNVEEKAREPTETEMRKAKKTAKEYMNFMSYDGSPQDDIID